MGERPTGKEGGGVLGGKSTKTVGVLVGFLVLFFAALVVASYLV